MKYKTGDKIIYRVQKYSTSPGKRAQNIIPSRKGEGYKYTVDKFWKVRLITDDKLILVTRTGKVHSVYKDDPKLRKAYFWEIWIYSKKFDFSHNIEVEEMNV